MTQYRRVAVGLVAASTAAGLTIPALAHDGATSYDGAVDNAKTAHASHQHGETDGHLPASQENVRLVSKLRLKGVTPEKIADVSVHEGYAYVADWGAATCKGNGVHVVDIRNPANPEEVSFVVSKEGSYPGEGVQALDLTTAAFRGDILVTNNETCKDGVGFGGINIYDVTKPDRPTPLAVGFGDETVAGQGKKNANETHSVFAWDAGDKAYAVMVDNEEGEDVDIVDITNPKTPRLIAEYDLDERYPGILQPGLTEVFLHDMVVKKIAGSYTMLLSYWDAGYVQLNVDDPRNVRLIKDSDFAFPDPEAAESGLTVPPEGNGHYAEYTRGNRYVIGADEDFDPYKPVSRNVTDGTDLHVGQGSDTTPLEPGDTITGPTTFVGRACNGDAAVPSGNPDRVDVAVVERGLCTFTEKVANVIAAGGYDAVVIFNREGSDACNATLGMSVAGDIPTFGVAPRGEGYAIFDTPYDNQACLAGDGSALAPIAVGTKGDTVTFSSYFDGWGYVHLFDRTTMEELDTYAVPEAHMRRHANGSGDLSVHEVATSHQQADLAYYAYYAAGFRVTRIIDDELVEVGHFIDRGGNNFWGVEAFEHEGTEYAAASDRDYGLYIFRYTGD